MLPVLAAVFRGSKLSVGAVWRVNETYVLVGGHWMYLYRAVDTHDQTLDFLLTAHRDVSAARRFLERAVDLHDLPTSITIDKSGANTAAVCGVVADSGMAIKLRRSKYLNNIVEQDHRAIERRTRPMLGFKSFRSAKVVRKLTAHLADRVRVLTGDLAQWVSPAAVRQSGSGSATHVNFRNALHRQA